MMCACEEERGKKFLSHQLTEGARLESQERVPVTLGFQASICNECRGLPCEAYPVTAIMGRTSKIKRYYWRELAFLEQDLFEQYGGLPSNYIHGAGKEVSELRAKASKQALADIKELHANNPKYTYDEESSDSVISRLGIHVRDAHAEYVIGEIRKAMISHDGRLLSVEEYAATVYKALGYEVLFLESVPFHVLFSAFCWPLIQDADDPNVDFRGFAERSAYEADGSKNLMWVQLPSDFGSPGYAGRRANQIEEYFQDLLKHENDLLWLFDYYLPYSEGLRQYLWAHKQEHALKARRIVQILEPKTILKIVRYLLGSYWKRYLGWSDLLVFNESRYMFVEVKSSKDKLSEEQKRWIENNSTDLLLPFEILKIHRA